MTKILLNYAKERTTHNRTRRCKNSDGRRIIDHNSYSRGPVFPRSVRYLSNISRPR